MMFSLLPFFDAHAQMMMMMPKIVWDEKNAMYNNNHNDFADMTVSKIWKKWIST